MAKKKKAADPCAHFPMLLAGVKGKVGTVRAQEIETIREDNGGMVSPETVVNTVFKSPKKYPSLFERFSRIDQMRAYDAALRACVGTVVRSIKAEYTGGKAPIRLFESVRLPGKDGLVSYIVRYCEVAANPKWEHQVARRFQSREDSGKTGLQFHGDYVTFVVGTWTPPKYP